MLNIHHISAALDYSCFKPGILWENISQIVKNCLKAESRVSTTGDRSVGLPQCREVSHPTPRHSPREAVQPALVQKNPTVLCLPSPLTLHSVSQHQWALGPRPL